MREKKGTVYRRNRKLWVDFHYLGERVRESSGLDDSRENWSTVRGQLDLVVAEIDNGVFQYENRFPHSKRKDYFRMLEGKVVTKAPSDVNFGDYSARWM